jgi:tRNA-specific 2-thiouridylase
MIHSKAKRVIVGLSGGVDSSVAALLLQNQSLHVEGLFMKNWQEDDNNEHCPATQDLADAQKVCKTLNIPLHTINFSNQYWDNVFEHALTEYRLGRTPNPDILCNREIKFKTFLDYALSLGADYIATGHYAAISARENIFQLHKAKDLNKDQSYFLYTLNQNALSKTLFPISHLDKPVVRKLALDAGFPNANKKDSTGICFIGERKFKNFLNTYLPTQKGNMETPDRKMMGQHDGLMFYTLGQRQGLGIGGRPDGSNAPWYVVGKDLARNVLIVAEGDNHPLLYGDTLTANQLHWVIGAAPETHFKCTAKIRYRQTEEPATIEMLNDADTCKVTFDNPQRAITPGQSVVFYDNTICLGGGIIQ